MHNFDVVEVDMDSGTKKPLLNDGEFEEVDPSEFFVEADDRDELNKRKETQMEVQHL